MMRYFVSVFDVLRNFLTVPSICAAISSQFIRISFAPVNTQGVPTWISLFSKNAKMNLLTAGTVIFQFYF